jgi:hypothetical protein
MADCVESEYRLDPIFSALQVRFSDADVGRLVICARLNGDRSKSIRPNDSTGGGVEPALKHIPRSGTF